MSPATTGRRYLLVKGAQGMGNRMLALATGMLYAKLSRRELLVDWRDEVYSDDGGNAFHRYFTSPSCDPSAGIPRTDDIAPGCWRGRLDESPTRLVRRSPADALPDAALEARARLDLDRLDHPEQLAVYWAYTSEVGRLRPHLQARLPQLAALPDEAILRRMLRDELALRPEIRERVDAFRARGRRSETLGVHVRYGDHRGALRDILREAQRILQRHPELELFLATDNAAVLRAVKRVRPDLRTTPHRYGVPGRALHLDRARPSAGEGGVEALVDLYVLAGCDRLVVDRSSSFARVAALLSGLPEAAVHDQRRRRKRSLRRGRVLNALWERSRLAATLPHLLARWTLGR